MVFNIWNYFGPYVRQYIVVITANLNFLGIGLGLTWSSPVLVKLQDELNPVLGTPITDTQGSWMISIPYLAGLTMNLPVAYLLDKIGRKYTMILGAIPRIGCYVILSFATEYWLILLAKILLGLSDTFTFTAVPMYATEIASKEIRGGLGLMLQIMCSLGMVIMLCMGPFLDYYLLNRVVLGIMLASFIPLLFLPKSPYFLNACGKKDESIKTLTFLRGSEATAMEEYKEFQIGGEEKPNILELLRNKTVLKALGIVIFLGMAINLTGYNAVQFYLQTILVSTNTSMSSELASVIIGVIQMCATICTVFVIDRFGKKPVLTITLAGLALGMLGLGIFFHLTADGEDIIGFLNYLPLISLVLVVFCFGAGLGSLQWPLMAEMFDGPARALGMSCGLVSSILWIFLTTRFFASVTNILGPALTYWMFSGFSVILCLFILFVVPETGGKSFAEIQRALEGKKEGSLTKA